MNLQDLQLVGNKKMLFEVKDNNSDYFKWLYENKSAIDDFISKEGALLLRGLPVQNDGEFAKILEILFGEDLVNYTYRSTPRKQINNNNVYTATEYHASEIIPQHNENAYSNKWPMRIGFLCVTPASKMGNTPISDSRVAYQQIPLEIREEFEAKKIMYVRNYSEIDLPWEEVFQTDNEKEVEKFCTDNDIMYEWTDNGLRTKQINQATMIHPVTKEKIWFNQAHLFHSSSLGKEVEESLIDLIGEENLPRNTFFGDGTPINLEYLDIIRDVFEKTKFSFDWQKNDVLLLDNMLYTHGRDPYEGERKVLVGMARPFQEN
ncbi:Taurine dioxygenase, alpha-ketoglutarate-dependent [Chryseobacterium taeanense]|uniref:Taurine dioxygenase, alpha-ketoglutarate-dependent n=1 Tax=Chryseobacterium taeanense TaxID=311334 RepID=A0A1G8J263_9FLAO|nr:TauD/TfdA family dioxygenase [Chryseobacterium taeanense]SDI25314.1 Taurine dioxygenase, alpha-ketoglutarate-dependent [Chryseobacterium taeanense]